MTGMYNGPPSTRQHTGPSYPLMQQSYRALDTLYWNDPLLLPFSMKSSFELDATTAETDQSLDIANFAAHLENVHKQICDKIQSAPFEGQGALLSVFTSWANHAAKEPMNPCGDDESLGTPEMKDV